LFLSQNLFPFSHPRVVGSANRPPRVWNPLGGCPPTNLREILSPLFPSSRSRGCVKYPTELLASFSRVCHHRPWCAHFSSLRVDFLLIPVQLDFPASPLTFLLKPLGFLALFPKTSIFPLCWAFFLLRPLLLVRPRA